MSRTIFAAVAAPARALRRVTVPLGVGRRATPKPLRAWRVVPLLAGLAELGFWTIHGHPDPAGGQARFVSSFALVVVGLSSRARGSPWPRPGSWPGEPGVPARARRLPPGRRPGPAFRAVSAWCWLSSSPPRPWWRSPRRTPGPDPVRQRRRGERLTDQVSRDREPRPRSAGNACGAAGPGPAAPAAPLAARPAGTPASRVCSWSARTGADHPQDISPASAARQAVVSCRAVATVPGLGRCRPGRRRRRPGGRVQRSLSAQTPPRHLACRERAGDAARHPGHGRHRRGDGRSTGGRAGRTVLEDAAPTRVSTLSTLGDIIAQDNSADGDYQRLREHRDTGQPPNRG